MALGIRLRSLWQMRTWVAACAALATVVSVWSVMKVSLLPPGLQSRSLAMAAASTQIVVDTPHSTLVDGRTDTYKIDALTNRAVIVGNLMASPPIREAIAARAHVPVELLHITPPLTPKQPYVLADEGTQRHTTDILKLNDEYRIFISASPTVPVLRVYALTRDPKSAAALANAVVDAADKRIREIAAASGTPGDDQIRLMQLGRATGTVIDTGVRLKVALLAFALTFGAGCACVVLLGRVREGWRVAALGDQPIGG